MATREIPHDKNFLVVVLQILSLLVSENEREEKIIECRNSLFDQIIASGLASPTHQRAFTIKDVIFVLLSSDYTEEAKNDFDSDAQCKISSNFPANNYFG